MKKFTLAILLFILGFCIITKAQNNLPGLSKNGQAIPITTAVPFLSIVPDARSGAMGDAGIATTPDVNASYHNLAKLALVDKPIGVSINYVPWLRSLVKDIHMAHVTGYYKFKEDQAISASLKYFSLGQIQFTDINGNETGQFKPNEFAFDLGYSRLLGKGFSTGLALRFIYSNLAAGQVTSGVTAQPALGAAADITFYYEKDIKVGDLNSKLSLGLVFNDIGSKITYTQSTVRDFIPMRMGLGGGYHIDVDDYNRISIVADAKKLLVPTPSDIDEDGNGIYDYREKSVPAGLFGSFADAPGGGQEELQEIYYSLGLEYWYDKQFAVRAGYFHENRFKGNRKFVTVGVGLRYSVFGIDFSYLVPTNAVRNPLDNTFRFSLIFDFESFGAETQQATPVD
ncbi:MAG: type IX secretion system outer membrane channel protein PorV [Chitinophagales bacterium]